MTNDEWIKLATIAATVCGGFLTFAGVAMQLRPNQLNAETARQQRSDDEARKQRDEIRAERDALKLELEHVEAERDDIKEQFHALRDQIADSRAICRERGNPCGQTFAPITLKPYPRKEKETNG